MSVLFWKEWPRAGRWLMFTTLFPVLISLLALAVATWRGPDAALTWAVLNELVELPVTFRQFTDGLLDYPLTGRAYAVTAQFVATPMNVAPSAAATLLVLVGVALALLLAGSTALPRLAYYGATAAFLLFLAVIRPALPDVPGLSTQMLFGILAALFGGVGYYFHAFRPGTPLPVRFATFVGLLAVVCAGLGYVARVPYPALTTLTYALPALLALSVAFTLFVGWEIVAGLVVLTTWSRGERPALGGRNFAVIVGLYALNLLLIYLKNTRAVEWSLLAVGPFMLYAVAVAVGLWNLRRQLDQQRSVSFANAGAWLYLGGALLTTSLMAYAHFTANDPLVEVFEDAIVFGQLAFGAAFLLYVLWNFGTLFRQGLPIYKVLYKPKTVPLPIFRLAGLLGVAGLLGASNYLAVKQAGAAYYNALGDVALADQQPVAAQEYYKISVDYEFQQHRANYALAQLALTRSDAVTAGFHFQQALLKQPTPQAAAGLAATYRQTGLFFEALKALQRGIRLFPDNGELRNNLGYLYATTALADSAYYYFTTAAERNSGDVARANRLALYARRPNLLTADTTLLRSETPVETALYRANALAVQLRSGKQIATFENEFDGVTGTSVLDAPHFAEVYNRALTDQPFQVKPNATLPKTLAKLADVPQNQAIADDLFFAQAVAEYNNSNPAEAFARLEQLAEGDTKNGTSLRRLAGLLLLEQGLYKPAAEQFALNSDTLSTYYQAVALTKAGELAMAIPAWEKASAGDAVAAGLRAALYGDRPPKTDVEKAFYVTYRPDDKNRGRVWERIANPNLKTVSGATLLDGFLADRQWFYAAMILSQMGKPERLNAFARSVENVAALRLVLARQKPAAFDSLMQKPIESVHEAERQFLWGQRYVLTNQPALAQSRFEQALRLAPLNARYVAGAANFLRQRGQVPRAYRYVLNALAYNPTDAGLLREYALLCLDQRLLDYAQEGLARLQTATSPADYQAFLPLYQQKRAQIENQNRNFGQ